MNLKYLLIIGCLFGLISCKDSQSEKPKFTPNRDTKSVTIDDFSLPELSPQSEQIVREWWEFKSLYKVLISIAPQQNKSVRLLKYTDPDSLYVFKRLYINAPDRIIHNAETNRDWRSYTGELVSDTVYEFKKNKKDDFATLSWNEILLANIPYTFSFRAKASSAKNLKVEVIRQKDKKIIQEQIICLDSLDKNVLQPYVKLDILPDNWLKISTRVEPTLYGQYLFSLGYNDKQDTDQYVSLYRTELLVPVKYQSDIEKSSEKLVRNATEIKSSYDGIYFWLFQVEDELRQLWARNTMPEQVKTPQVTSRLRLFETYVCELSDNVKNNSELTEKDIRLGIKKIQQSFAAVISYINILNKDDLDTRMQMLLEEYSTTLPNQEVVNQENKTENQ